MVFSIELQKTYPMSFPGVFHTIQGEGHLAGLPMVFIRLGGCSIGCPGCDTDYRVRGRLTSGELAALVVSVKTAATKWCWITGGEPADHDLDPLVNAIHSVGLFAAVATSGHLPTDRIEADFLSVSPHTKDWTHRRKIRRFGEEVKLVFRLNGLAPFEAMAESAEAFDYKFVAPVMDRERRADAMAVRDCVEWVSSRPGWRMASQAHKQWNLL